MTPNDLRQLVAAMAASIRGANIDPANEGRVAGHLLAAGYQPRHVAVCLTLVCAAAHQLPHRAPRCTGPETGQGSVPRP